MPQTAAPSPGQPFRPGVANVFYANAVKFGKDAGRTSMSDVTDFQGQRAALERLAGEGQEEENEDMSPVERLLAMAERDPESSVDYLMNIINGRG
jgi:hypothetical protein